MFDFLDGITIVNSLGLCQPERVAEGMGCLAAQFVAEFKNGAGGFYMTYPDDSQEYDYTVNYYWELEGYEVKTSEVKTSGLIITVANNGQEIFTGTLMDFGLFIDSLNDEEDEVA